jgi:hypothetical protein
MITYRIRTTQIGGARLFGTPRPVINKWLAEIHGRPLAIDSCPDEEGWERLGEFDTEADAKRHLAGWLMDEVADAETAADFG